MHCICEITVSVSCGGVLNAQPYGQKLISPEYPKNYPNGLECVWKINAAAGQLISFYVNFFIIIFVGKV